MDNGIRFIGGQQPQQIKVNPMFRQLNEKMGDKASSDKMLALGELIFKMTGQLDYNMDMLQENGDRYNGKDISAWDMREYEHQRTIEKKDGVCLNFSFALSKEMDKLGIDHRIGTLTGDKQDYAHAFIVAKDKQDYLRLI